MLFNELHPPKGQCPILATDIGMAMLSKEVQPAKARFPMVVTQSGMVILSKEVQPSKAPSVMLVTQSGMVMLFKELHRAKASHPISVTEQGMVMRSKEVQLLKALPPIKVTESWMVMRCKEVQAWKAPSPILVTQLGRVMLSKEVQCLNAPSAMLVTQSGMVMLSKEVQPWKAASPISATEEGMVMLCKEVQSLKALPPMEVTEPGMVMLRKELQSSKAQTPISVTESGMVTFTSRWQEWKARSRTLPTVWGIFTWQNSAISISHSISASSSFRPYMTTVTSDSLPNPDSFSVSSSYSKHVSFSTPTFRIFCSMGSSQNFSRNMHFSCCTVSMLVTSRVKASPFKMFTVNSWGIAASMDAPGKNRPNICGMSRSNRQTIHPKEPSCNEHWYLIGLLPSTSTQIQVLGPSIGENSSGQMFQNKSQRQIIRLEIPLLFKCRVSWVLGQHRWTWLAVALLHRSLRPFARLV